jgi:hypothetical protein
MRKTLSLLTAALLLTGGGVGLAAAASATEVNEGVCTNLDTGHIDPGAKTPSLEIFAPEGKLIVGYCVKAGSIKQGDGPEYTTVVPGQTSVVISHLTGKDISHYSVDYADIYAVTPPVYVAPTCDAAGTFTGTDTASYTFVASGPATARILTATPVGDVVLTGTTVFGPHDLTQLTGEDCDLGGGTEVTVIAPVVVAGTCSALGTVTGTNTADYTFVASGPVTARILTATPVGDAVLTGTTVFGPYNLSKLTGEACSLGGGTTVIPVVPVVVPVVPVVVPAAPVVVPAAPAPVVVARPTFTG